MSVSIIIFRSRRNIHRLFIYLIGKRASFFFFHIFDIILLSQLGHFLIVCLADSLVIESVYYIFSGILKGLTTLIFPGDLYDNDNQICFLPNRLISSGLRAKAAFSNSGTITPSRKFQDSSLSSRSVDAVFLAISAKSAPPLSLSRISPASFSSSTKIWLASTSSIANRSGFRHSIPCFFICSLRIETVKFKSFAVELIDVKPLRIIGDVVHLHICCR